MISHALDNQTPDLSTKLVKIVPDVKELVKLGLLISKHGGTEKANMLYDAVKDSQNLNALFYYAKGMIKGKFDN
jgi:hypothetical protein